MTNQKTTMPSLFVSHGAPDLTVNNHPAKAFLQQLGGTFPRPRAVVIISAHWQTRQLSMTAAGELQTIHDFAGFPKALYDQHYPAHTPPWLVERLADLFADTDYGPVTVRQRGLDHGAWVPLSLIYPKAEIPVIQLSLLQGATPQQHHETGQVLAPLLQEEILIISSGSTVHNLMEIIPEGTPPPDWAVAFDDWLFKSIKARDFEALFNYASKAPHAHRAHPTPEHLSPLFVSLGAGSNKNRIKRLHNSYSYGSIGMSSYSA